MLDRRSRPPSVNRQGHIRERRLNNVVVMYCDVAYSALSCTIVAISHEQIKLIALSLFRRQRRVARSTNYRGHGHGARSLQWNSICRAAGQSSVYRVLFILQIALPTSLLTDS